MVSSTFLVFTPRCILSASKYFDQNGPTWLLMRKKAFLVAQESWLSRTSSNYKYFISALLKIGSTISGWKYQCIQRPLSKAVISRVSFCNNSWKMDILFLKKKRGGVGWEKGAKELGSAERYHSFQTLSCCTHWTFINFSHPITVRSKPGGERPRQPGWSKSTENWPWDNNL